MTRCPKEKRCAMAATKTNNTKKKRAWYDSPRCCTSNLPACSILRKSGKSGKSIQFKDPDLAIPYHSQRSLRLDPRFPKRRSLDGIQTKTMRANCK